MPFEIDPIYLVYLLVAVSAGFLVEGIYLLFFSGASYRKTVNRRLKLLRNEPNRENILVQLRKERGLTSTGGYRIGLEALNRLVLQSGLTIGMSKLFTCAGISAVIAFGLGWVLRRDLLEAFSIALFCGTALPYFVLRSLRGSPRPYRAHHGRARNARSHRQRVRYRRGRDHLWGGSRNCPAQPLFPDRSGRSAVVRHGGCDPGINRRQSGRNPRKPVGRDPPAFQDAPQDQGPCRRRPHLRDHLILAPDRDVPDHPGRSPRLLCQRL